MAINSLQRSRFRADFRLMAELGITPSACTPRPGADLLDEAARWGLRVIVGLRLVPARCFSRQSKS